MVSQWSPIGQLWSVIGQVDKLSSSNCMLAEGLTIDELLE